MNYLLFSYLFLCSPQNWQLKMMIILLLSLMVLGVTGLSWAVVVFFFFLVALVFIAACVLSLVAASGGYSSSWCTDFSLQRLLLLWSTGCRHAGPVVTVGRLSTCGSQAFVAPRCGGSSWTRD